jgi:hypothetical protein
MNEPESVAGIDPGMAFNPFPSSIWIRRDLNPQPLDRVTQSFLNSNKIIVDFLISQIFC